MPKNIRYSQISQVVFGPGAETVDWKMGFILHGALFVRGWGLGGAIPRLQDRRPRHVVRLDGHLRRAVAFARGSRRYGVRRHRNEAAAFHETL